MLKNLKQSRLSFINITSFNRILTIVTALALSAEASTYAYASNHIKAKQDRAPAASQDNSKVQQSVAQKLKHISKQESSTEKPKSLGAVLTISPSTIKQLQQLLNQMGYDAGSVDGYFGAKTQSAIKDFQKARKLEPTGQINLETLATLGVGIGPDGLIHVSGEKSGTTQETLGAASTGGSSSEQAGTSEKRSDQSKKSSDSSSKSEQSAGQSGGSSPENTPPKSTWGKGTGGVPHSRVKKEEQPGSRTGSKTPSSSKEQSWMQDAS